MSVRAVAFVPGAPLLVPELAGAGACELDEVRAAADAAVAGVCGAGVCGAGGGDLAVVVLGSGPDARSYPGTLAGTFRPWGVDVRVGDPQRQPQVDLPLSLTIGAWFLDRAGVELSRRTYHAVTGHGRAEGATDPPVAADLPVAADDCVLVVVGDGSATRTPKAPGSFDPAGEPFDTAVVDALGSGHPDRLLALDVEVAHRVQADGLAAWRAASHASVGRTFAAEVLASDAPYGVGYVVAVWR